MEGQTTSLCSLHSRHHKNHNGMSRWWSNMCTRLHTRNWKGGLFDDMRGTRRRLFLAVGSSCVPCCIRCMICGSVLRVMTCIVPIVNLRVFAFGDELRSSSTTSPLSCKHSEAMSRFVQAYLLLSRSFQRDDILVLSFPTRSNASTDFCDVAEQHGWCAISLRL